jgi:hypothetical protein
MISGSQFLVRVFRDGTLEGGGFPIASDLVLTCAHVVGSPSATVTIDAPALSGERKYEAVIEEWIGDAAEDLCVLRLTQETIPGLEPPALVVACDLLGDAWRVIGFPDRYDEGIEASRGVIGQRLPSGRIQLDSPTITGHAIAPGFSGAPVWDETMRAFVGIVAESDQQPGTKTATMIPLDAFAESFDVVANAMNEGFFGRWRRWEEAQRANIALQAALAEWPLHVQPAASKLWSAFSRENGWHVLVSDEIETMLDAAAGIDLPSRLYDVLDALQTIDCDVSYPQILDALRSTVPKTLVGDIRGLVRAEEERQRVSGNPLNISPRWMKLHRLQQAAWRLGRLAAEPRFARCFLLAGRFGSGKTHFLASLLNASSFGLHLPVVINGDDIGDAILAAARSAGEIEWKSLADLDAMLSLLSERGEIDLDLFAHFDDIDTAIRRTPSLLPNIVSFIDTHTSLHSLRYIMTIQDAQYDRVATQFQFWQRQTAVGARYEDDDEPAAVAHAGGWVILDDLNEQHETGQAIMRAGLLPQMHHELELEHGKRMLAHPLTAVILTNLGGRMGAVSLNFPEFVDDFWRRRKATLDPTPFSLLDVDEAIALLAHLVANIGETPFVRHLLQRVSERSLELFGVVWTAERFNAVLDVIQTANLIRIELAVRDDPASRRLLLLFETFWSHHLAIMLMRVLKGMTSAKKINRALRSWFEKPSLASLAEGTLELLIFLLLRSDAENGEDRTSPVVRAAFAGQGLSPAAPWLAGAHLAPELQKRFLDDGLPSITPASPLRSTFAFLYFLRNADVSPGEQLAASSRSFEAVATHKLSTYYFYFFERAIERFTSASDLAGALLAMEGVEPVGITPSLGSSAAAALSGLLRTSAVLDVLVSDYLRPLSMRGPAPRLKDQAWHRFFFREWLLHFVLTDLAERLSITLYDILRGQAWYDAGKIGIRFPISRDMEREANIALGAKYRRMRDWRDRQAYQDKLRSMIDSEDILDRVAAFFIIRHTEPPGDTDRVVVRHEFRSMLDLLSRDSQVVGRVASFAGLFAANVPHFVPPRRVRK